MNTNETFHYTYSAKEQEEIKKIRSRYLPKKEDNMTRLRRLDAAVNQKATAVSLVVGIIGVLIMGFGMSLIMTDIGKTLGLFHPYVFPVGLICGIIGMAAVCLAYPSHHHVLKREREKIAPEILRLSEELLK